MTATTQVYVTSAVMLTENQISALKNLMSKKLGKQVEISPEIDSSLIGGLSIRFDGIVLDCTVKKQLQDLKENLKRGGAG